MSKMIPAEGRFFPVRQILDIPSRISLSNHEKQVTQSQKAEDWPSEHQIQVNSDFSIPKVQAFFVITSFLELSGTPKSLVAFSNFHAKFHVESDLIDKTERLRPALLRGHILVS